MTWQVVARAGPGVRTVNEDYVVADPGCGLVAVIDGAGGAITGVLAARLAAAALRDHLRASPGDLRGACHLANRRILDAAASEGRSIDPAGLDRFARSVIAMAIAGRGTLRGMSAQVVAVVLGEGAVSVAHAGCCRAYRVAIASSGSGGAPGSPSIERLTADHAMLDGRVATRALGIDPELELTLVTVELARGDRLLLCSDGVHAVIDDAALLAACDAPIDVAIAELARLASERGAENHAIALATGGAGTWDAHNGDAW